MCSGLRWSVQQSEEKAVNWSQDHGAVAQIPKKVTASANRKV